MSEHLWIPSEEEAAAAHISAFIEMVGRELGAAHPTYGDLYAWSVEEPERFWSALWDFVGIIAETRGKSVIEDGRNMIGARFFPGARLSFAENLLRRRDSGIAVIARSEDGVRRFVTHQDLYDQVSRIAQALLALGMSPEDRIAAILPNVPETLAGMLAANSIGAIWTSCSPEFGARGIADRLGQVDPKVLFVVESYCYKGRRYDVSGSLEEFRVRLPGVEHVIVVPAPGEDGPPRPEEGAIPFADFVAPFAPAEIAFARLPFDHPAFIVYTSGTTDQPKCIVHGAGRVLLQFLKEHWLHFDVRPGDRFFFTTTGWNIWYTLVTSLGAGGTVVMYDGAPFHPHAGVLFDLVEEEGITHFGTFRDFAHVHRSRQTSRSRAPYVPRPLVPEDDPVDGLAALARVFRLRLRPHQERRAPFVDLRRHRDHDDLREWQPHRARLPRRASGADTRHGGPGVRLGWPGGAGGEG